MRSFSCFYLVCVDIGGPLKRTDNDGVSVKLSVKWCFCVFFRFLGKIWENLMATLEFFKTEKSEKK